MDSTGKRQVHRARKVTMPLNEPALKLVSNQLGGEVGKVLAEAAHMNSLAQLGRSTAKQAAQEANVYPGITAEHGSLTPPATVPNLAGSTEQGSLAGLLREVNSATSLSQLASARAKLGAIRQRIAVGQQKGTTQYTNGLQQRSRLDPNETRFPHKKHRQALRRLASVSPAAGNVHSGTLALPQADGLGRSYVDRTRQGVDATRRSRAVAA